MTAVVRKLLCAAFFSCLYTSPVVAATGESGADQENTEERQSGVQNNSESEKKAVVPKSSSDGTTREQVAPDSMLSPDRSYRLPQANRFHDPHFFEDPAPSLEDEDEDEDGSEDYFLDDPEREQGKVQPI